MLMSSLSEAFQKKLNRKDCPYLHDCNVAITKDEPRILTDGLARTVDEIETLMAG